MTNMKNTMLKFIIFIAVLGLLSGCNNDKGKYSNQWVQKGNDYYYYDNNGEKIKNTEKRIGNDTFYFNDKGKMVTGFQTVNGKKKFYGTEGKLKTGWQKYNDEYYLLDDDGIIKSGWVEDKGDWYYLNENGQMYKNKLIDDYYVGTDGKMLKNTSVTIDGKEYCFGANGKVKSEFDYISDEYKQYYAGVIAKQVQYNKYTKGAHIPVYQKYSSDTVFDAIDSSRFGSYDYINIQDKPIEMEVYYIGLWDLGFYFTSPKHKNQYSLRAILDNQVRYNDNSSFARYPGSVKGEIKKTEYLARKVKHLKNGDKIIVQGFLMWTEYYNEWLLYLDDFQLAD